MSDEQERALQLAFEAGIIRGSQPESQAALDRAATKSPWGAVALSRQWFEMWLESLPEPPSPLTGGLGR